MEMFIKGMYIVHYNTDPYDSGVARVELIIAAAVSTKWERGKTKKRHVLRKGKN